MSTPRMILSNLLVFSFFFQFIIYGSYFFIIGAVFLARAVFHMTRVGWRHCWQQRHVQIDTQALTAMSSVEEEEGGSGNLLA